MYEIKEGFIPLTVLIKEIERINSFEKIETVCQ